MSLAEPDACAGVFSLLGKVVLLIVYCLKEISFNFSGFEKIT